MKVSAALKDCCLSLEEGQPPPAQASVELGKHEWNQIMLAQAGDLITPASYLAELHMIEKLDQAIDRYHNRLMKMKEDRKGTAAPTKTTIPTKPTMVSSLSPSWVKRRRLS